MFLFHRYKASDTSENKKRAGRVRSAIWFASHGKVESLVRRETGVILPAGQTTPALLRVLVYNVMENCVGFTSGQDLDGPGMYEPFIQAVRVPSYAFSSGNWIREALGLPFTGQEMGARLREASRNLERGVSFAWGETDGRHGHIKMYGDGDVFKASECLADGMATLYRGILEACVERLKAKGDEGATKLQLGLKQSRLGDEFAQTVAKNRETLVENPQLARSYGTGTGTGAAQPVRVLTDHTLLTAAADVIPECALTAFTLQCGHGKRGYILDVLNGKPTDGSRYLLQVVSEQNKFDEIVVNFAGTCGYGKKGCPTIQVNGNNETWNSPHKFNVKYKTTQVTDRFGLFVKRFLIPEFDALVPEEYIITARGCSTPLRRAVVQSFPPFKSWGKISFGYNPDAAESQTGKTGGFLDAWSLESELGYYVGDSTWKFQKGKIEDYFPKLGAAAGSVVKSISDLVTEAKEEKKKYGKIVKVQLKSKVSLGADVELLESKGDYDVNFGGKIDFKLNPLIGADVHVDILQVLIRRAPGISSFLTMVRERAAKGIGNDKVSASAIVELNLIISGQVAATLAWKKNAKDKWLSAEGEKTAKRSVSLTISLEGKIEVKTKIFYVKITVGAGFDIKGSRSKTEGIGGVMDLFATTAEGKPAVGGEFIFTGATIYYLYYAEVSIMENPSAEVASSASGKRSVSSEGTTQKNKTYARREEKSGKYELLEAQTWPKWRNDNDKNMGAGFEKLDI